MHADQVPPTVFKCYVQLVLCFVDVVHDYTRSPPLVFVVFFVVVSCFLGSGVLYVDYVNP